MEMSNFPLKKKSTGLKFERERERSEDTGISVTLTENGETKPVTQTKPAREKRRRAPKTESVVRLGMCVAGGKRRDFVEAGGEPGSSG